MENVGYALVMDARSFFIWTPSWKNCISVPLTPIDVLWSVLVNKQYALNMLLLFIIIHHTLVLLTIKQQCVGAANIKVCACNPISGVC